MSEPGRMAALAAYRHVLQATKVAFRGDRRILMSAREQARASFLKDRTLAPGSDEAAARVRHAEEVAVFLRQNLVQGERVADAGEGEGEGSGAESQRYKLNVHDETERGDNEYNRRGKQEMGSLAGAKASKLSRG